MTELAEKLAAKHTRREIEEMAEKLGITTIGISKLKMAEAVTDARKKAPVVEKPRAKVAKATAKPVRSIGMGGVFALQADMGKKAAEIESFVSDLQRSAVEMHRKGVMEMQKGINAQIKENEKGAAKMESGVRELHEGIAQMQADFAKKSMEMQRGVEEIQKGIREMENIYKEFQNETMDYINDFYYG